jgi:hypothetical protein
MLNAVYLPLDDATDEPVDEESDDAIKVNIPDLADYISTRNDLKLALKAFVKELAAQVQA